MKFVNQSAAKIPHTNTNNRHSWENFVHFLSHSHKHELTNTIKPIVGNINIVFCNIHNLHHYKLILLLLKLSFLLSLPRLSCILQKKSHTAHRKFIIFPRLRFLFSSVIITCVCVLSVDLRCDKKIFCILGRIVNGVG